MNYLAFLHFGDSRIMLGTQSETCQFLKLGAIVCLRLEKFYFEVTNENIDRNRMRSKRIWTDLI